MSSIFGFLLLKVNAQSNDPQIILIHYYKRQKKETKQTLKHLLTQRIKNDFKIRFGDHIQSPGDAQGVFLIHADIMNEESSLMVQWRGMESVMNENNVMEHFLVALITEKSFSNSVLVKYTLSQICQDILEQFKGNSSSEMTSSILLNCDAVMETVNQYVKDGVLIFTPG